MENLPISNRSLGSAPVNPAREKRIDRDKLKKSCTEFEAMVISQLFKSMRRTIIPSGFTGDGLGKGMYESLFYQEISQRLANGGGIGLGKIIYQRIIEQEERRGPTPSEEGKDERGTIHRIIRR